jgi:hypothetical protein
MWQVTGTAIAHAPTITDLKTPTDIQFDIHGHHCTRRDATRQDIDCAREATVTSVEPCHETKHGETVGRPTAQLTLDDTEQNEDYIQPQTHSWPLAVKKGMIAFWKFFITPTGFCIILYGLNVVAWGAMLFFLLLKVGSMSQLRKDQWIEIDSQVLNGLFCPTSWGLAPWRFRDLYWLCVWQWTSGTSSKQAIARLAERNHSWFGMRDQDISSVDGDNVQLTERPTFTGDLALSTKPWKMDFVVVMMVLNSLLQAGMASSMWCYDRHNRPNFGVGLFIGLGCLTALLAGIVSWWEDRRIKKIEGRKLYIDRV